MVYLALRKRPKSNKLIDVISHFAIKFRIVLEYSHAGMYCDGWMHEITLKNDMTKTVLEDKTGWDFFKTDLTKDELEVAYVKHLRYKYDAFSLLAFLGIKARDSDRLYCFEWCYLAMTGENPKFKVTPEILLKLCLKG